MKGRMKLNQYTAVDPQAIIDMDATEIAGKIIDGSLTSMEAANAYISHINRANPYINAMVETRFDQALNEARKTDQTHQTPRVGQLAGVPISVKESFDVSGMKTTAGLLSRKNALRDTDAAVVGKLKQEGAIILGKTNTPEMCFCQETDNKLYGRTNNPWDLARTAGGSSGGEGALHAVGGAAVGIGADIGGSIRFPSHFNGIIGMKSGMNHVSAQGCFPPFVNPLQNRMLGIGPMGKTVRDIRLVYDIVADSPVKPESTESVQIDILPDDINEPLSRETAHILNNIARFLEGDFPVHRKIPPFFTDSAQIWQEIMSIDGARDIAAIASPTSSMIREFMKEKLTKKSGVHLYLSWALVGAKMFQPSEKRIGDMTAFLEQGDAVLHDYLDHRVLILPVYHQAAPQHGKVYRDIFSIRKTFKRYMPYVAYANVWGLPALTIPAGTDAEGMPIGVQLIGQNGKEDLLFQIGEKLEIEFGGYKRCERFD